MKDVLSDLNSLIKAAFEFKLGRKSPLFEKIMLAFHRKAVDIGTYEAFNA